VNAYEVEAGMMLFAGKTVCSMPERLRSFTTRRYVNPLYLYLYLMDPRGGRFLKKKLALAGTPDPIRLGYLQAVSLLTS